MNRLPTPDEVPEPLAALMREHEHVAALLTHARATFDGATVDDAGGVATRVIEVARDLQAFLARDLMLHIAKEEEVLFPPLEALAHELEDAVVHAVAQHDEIRVRRDLIDRTMAALDAHHDEIEEERAGFVERVRSGLAAPSSQWLAELQERAMRIERILLGHFAEEEEDLFVPAATLLSPEVLARLAEQMAALERAAPRSGASSGAGEGW